MNTFGFRCDYDDELKWLTVYYARGDGDVNVVLDKLKNEYPDVEELRFMGDYFDSIAVPEGIKTVFLDDLGLKSVHLPDTITDVYISHNKLVKLELPKGVRKVIANANILTEVTFRDGNPVNLEEIDLECNRLLSFCFKPPESLVAINLSFNDNLVRENVSPEILRIIDTNEDCYWGKPGNPFER